MISARSLVGMSMGARKRSARCWLWPEDRRRDGLKAFREMIAECPAVKHEYHGTRRRMRIGERLRPCPGCALCLTEDQIRARIERPRIVGFWGNTYTVKPALVPRIFGDGKAWLHFEPLNTRPSYYVVRINSDVAEEDVGDLIDEICDAICEEWGSTDSYECQCTPKVRWCEECRPEWPALNYDCGSSWGIVEPYLPLLQCEGSGVLPARRQRNAK